MRGAVDWAVLSAGFCVLQELDSDAKLQLVDESAALMLEAAAQFQASGHMDRCIDCYSKSAKYGVQCGDAASNNVGFRFCHDHRADRALMTYNKMAQMCNNVSLDMVAMLIDFVRDAIGYVCGQRRCTRCSSMRVLMCGSASFDVAIELLALHKKWALHLGQVRALNQVLQNSIPLYHTCAELVVAAVRCSQQLSSSTWWQGRGSWQCRVWRKH